MRYVLVLRCQAPRRFVCGVDGKMGYQDFCWFILSEEDKTSEISLEYWFKCVDLDCDGALRANEMLVWTLPICSSATLRFGVP